MDKDGGLAHWFSFPKLVFILSPNRGDSLSQCSSFKRLIRDQMATWFKLTRKGDECADSHRTADNTIRLDRNRISWTGSNHHQFLYQNHHHSPDSFIRRVALWGGQFLVVEAVGARRGRKEVGTNFPYVVLISVHCSITDHVCAYG